MSWRFKTIDLSDGSIWQRGGWLGWSRVDDNMCSSTPYLRNGRLTKSDYEKIATLADDDSATWIEDEDGRPDNYKAEGSDVPWFTNDQGWP